MLGKTDQQNSLRVEIAVISREPKPRAVYADRGKSDEPPARVKHFEVEIVCKFVQRYRFAGDRDFVHNSSSIAYFLIAAATPCSSHEGTVTAIFFNLSSAFSTANFPPARSSIS